LPIIKASHHGPFLESQKPNKHNDIQRVNVSFMRRHCAFCSGTFSPKVLINAVRPEGADHLWRKVPPRELSIALVADERFGWATGWIEAS
jgi:hypothetical protein